MKPRTTDSPSFTHLRVRAEAELHRNRKATPPDGVMHELQVHEIELQMQNETLRDLNEELMIAQERYRGLFEHAPVAYLVLERDSTIVEANAAACTLLHERCEALLGRKLSSFVAPASVDAFNLHLRAVLANDEAQTHELALLRGGTVPREVRIDSARERMDKERWHTALIDLTDSRRLERRLERSRRLEAIGTFTSGIAHDFSTLLAVVASGAELALEQGHVGGDPLVPIERVKRAAMQGKEMVRQLLRFASDPAGESSGISLALDSAIRTAAPTLRVLLGERVALELELEAPDAHVCLDAGGPEEILRNLASNAEHAMPNGGKLRISTALESPGHLILTVSDDGVGMDSETLSRAFEPFFTTKPAGRGTGLGLAMVYGIVKRAGGYVELISEPGCGTTFRIHLPLCAA